MENKVATVTYTSSVLTIFGGLTLNNWLAIGGFIVAVISMVAQITITIYFKQKHLELARQRVQQEKEELLRGGDD